jgi:hypothetical protein
LQVACYQTPPALQPPLLAWSQPRLILPSAAFVIVKCVPDFDSADTVKVPLPTAVVSTWPWPAPSERPVVPRLAPADEQFV